MRQRLVIKIKKDWPYTIRKLPSQSLFLQELWCRINTDLSSASIGINMHKAADYLEVIEIKVLDGQRLFIKFSDGMAKEVSLAMLLENPPPVFIKLKDEEEFRKVNINPVGGVSWSCGADLSAEYLRSTPLKISSKQ